MSVSLLVLAFFISFIICFLIVKLFDKNKNSILADTNEGPQKFHTKPTPRIGGLAVFLAVSTSLVILYVAKHNTYFIYYLLACLPAFVAGFFEDITKKVGVLLRLLSTMLSSSIGILFLSAIVSRLDIQFLDSLLKIYFISVAFTVVAVSGVTNAMNIIDGYNGLLSIVSIMILVGLLYVSYKVHDSFVAANCFVLIGAIAGFFIWNYPFGKIFLGDGGAYFIGFNIAEMSVILINKHHNVSAWFPLLLVIYPVFETLFSIYRKKFIRDTSPGQPDRLHFHMLIYERVVPYFYGIDRDNKLARNSATSPFLWLVCSIGVIPAIIFWNNTLALQISAVIFCIFYILFYMSIVKFKIGKIIK